MANNIYNRTFSYYIIYETTCIVNSKTYIGCHATDNIDDGYMGSGKLLLAAFKKYGRKNFKRTVLHIYTNPQDMFSKEKELVNDEFVSSASSYNLVPGGSGGFKIQDPDDWREKLKASRKGKTPAAGLIHSEETKRKISASLKGKSAWNKGLPGTWAGKSHSNESKQKISISKKGQSSGEKNPMYGKSAVAGRKWYNDGKHTYYLFPSDPATSNLTLGRLPKPTA
jgi:group I intron endonuclease